VEHCCFCAIDPARRSEYVDAVADVLVDGGEFVGLLRTRCPPGGPPFAVDAAEVEQLFSRRFVLISSGVPEDSIEPRRGTELLVHMKRR
ncbi:MAG TPA: SAM-dependent methyltransferase, partial [Polyangia bacterium]